MSPVPGGKGHPVRSANIAIHSAFFNMLCPSAYVGKCKISQNNVGSAIWFFEKAIQTSNLIPTLKAPCSNNGPSWNPRLFA